MKKLIAYILVFVAYQLGGETNSGSLVVLGFGGCGCFHRLACLSAY